MAFVQGVSEKSAHGYKYCPQPLIYPEQQKAIYDMRLAEAADLYWKTYKATGDYGQACNAIRYKLTPKELQSDDFSHVLQKRQPAIK